MVITEAKKQGKEKKKKKKKKTSGTCGIKTKDLAFMSSQYLKTKRKRMGLKTYLKKLAKTFPNFGKDLNLLIQEIE